MSARLSSSKLRNARTPLLQGLHAVVAQRLALWPELLAGVATAHGQSWQWHGPLSEEPAVAAVRVAHAVEMGPPGLQGWYADWPSVLEPAALQFAAAAAGLLAGCDPLLLLASATDGSGADAGALIDGESCARMSAAGFDPETEARLGNCVELLGSAGDLLSVSATGGGPLGTTPLLILGMKWHAPAGD
jgi:hypothetical protein